MKNITTILKVLGGMVGVVVLILILIVLARFFSCGPDSADVKVMKPMAEKISEYIVKNGIPESLKDIPNLPYGLENCVKNIEYKKVENGDWIKTNIEDSTDTVKIENCIFITNNRTINLIAIEESSFSTEEEYFFIRMKNNASKTIANIDFAKMEENNFKVESPLKFMDFKSRGICTSFRQ